MGVVGVVGAFDEAVEELVDGEGGGCEWGGDGAREGEEEGDGVGFGHVGEEHGEFLGVGLFGVLYG